MHAQSTPVPAPADTFFTDVQTDFGGPLTADDWNQIKTIESRGDFYHTVSFDDGSGWSGRYDMNRLLRHYHLPEDLSGQSVLEVGPADGFFSFLAESRNAARVLAVQPSPPYKGFAYAHRQKRSRVGFCRTSIYDLNRIESPADQFDHVFCFSVLLHLPDLYSAMTGLARATRNVAYIATTIDEAAETGDLASKPYVYFQGERKGDGITSSSYYIYWYPNTCALIRMAKLAGFREAEDMGRFYLSQALTPPRDTSTHILLRCTK